MILFWSESANWGVLSLTSKKHRWRNAVADFGGIPWSVAVIRYMPSTQARWGRGTRLSKSKVLADVTSPVLGWIFRRFLSSGNIRGKKTPGVRSDGEGEISLWSRVNVDCFDLEHGSIDWLILMKDPRQDVLPATDHWGVVSYSCTWIKRQDWKGKHGFPSENWILEIAYCIHHGFNLCFLALPVMYSDFALCVQPGFVCVRQVSMWSRPQVVAYVCELYCAFMSFVALYSLLDSSLPRLFRAFHLQQWRPWRLGLPKQALRSSCQRADAFHGIQSEWKRARPPLL